MLANFVKSVFMPLIFYGWFQATCNVKKKRKNLTEISDNGVTFYGKLNIKRIFNNVLIKKLFKRECACSLKPSLYF